MTVKMVLVGACALLVGWPSVAWADDGPCGSFAEGSISRIECERNVRIKQSMPQNRWVEPPIPQRYYPSVSRGTPSGPLSSDPYGNPGEALCGKYLGGTAEEAEHWLACRKAVEEGRHPAQIGARQALEEQRRQMQEQQREERRTRAVEEAAQAQREQAQALWEQAEAQRQQAQAQRDAANAANQTRTCKTVGYELGRPIIECYTPRFPATRYDQ